MYPLCDDCILILGHASDHGDDGQTLKSLAGQVPLQQTLGAGGMNKLDETLRLFTQRGDIHKLKQAGALTQSHLILPGEDWPRPPASLCPRGRLSAQEVRNSLAICLGFLCMRGIQMSWGQVI